MSRWFRLDDDVINDPKILMLPEAMRWQWIAMLCVASKNDGKIPSIDHVAILLRVTKQGAASIIAALHSAGLIDKTGAGFEPHNWNGRQYKSDVSTDRVKRFRETQRNAARNVSETPPETDTDTEAEIETEKPENIKKSARALSNDGLKVLKTDLREIVGDAVDVGLSASWIDKGYPREMIIEVVKSMFARKPDIASLAYCEAALAERHARMGLKSSERAAGSSKINWDTTTALYAKTGVWSRWAGPDPDQASCQCPVEILIKHGLRKMAEA